MNKQSALLGAAIAGILSASAGAVEIPKDKLQFKGTLVPCYGVNKCNAHGSCSSATHGCGGQNGCKGTGWVAMPKESCEAIGGSLTPTKESKKG